MLFSETQTLSYSNQTTMIKISELSKVYRTEDVETLALNALSLEVKKGEFISVMGPSGCGKSTLLNILGLLDNPSAGSYLFAGEETAQLNEKERARLRKSAIGFVFQSFNLIDELSVFENIELPLIYQKMSTSERKHRVEEVMQRLNIAHRAKHFPQQLSGGQQQRVAVCRAIVIEPKLILADEPTGNLDSKNGEEVMALLEQLHDEGATVLMVTHSPEHALRAERVIHMLDGQVISEEFTSNYRSKEMEA